MHELLFRNSVSKDKKRTELFSSELMENTGAVQELEKKTVYAVKEILEFTDPFDLELFLNQKKKEGAPPQTFIIRNRNTRQRKDKVLYKVVGSQYVVLGDKVFVLQSSQYVKKTIAYK
ncbi:MAG TPA: hypothetical protein PL155_02270 [Candidatus Omnitrophota bacterium]|nr:hypothetical protein [Candidatus Omnitrophota bacterium]HPD84689.1 hypothetical protein [Candidatus Omnitrophota bacterium]HRZ03547.1 hypothetical protein [Candidatus Omnitrophota bacterium]